MEYVPVAVNCSVVPWPKLGPAGVNTMVCSTGATTFTRPVAVRLPDVMVRVVVPTVFPVTMPWSTVATAGLLEVQLTYV